MKTPEQIYRFHVANLRSVGIALDHTARAGRDAIRRRQSSELASFVRAYSLLLGVEAETRLCKLSYERGGFAAEARAAMLTRDTQLERWRATIETAFRMHYHVSHAQLGVLTLPHDAFHRYATLQSIVKDQLGPVIAMRNKLAHGQWAYQLNAEGDDVAQDMFDIMRKETLFSLEQKRHLARHMAAAIHDLVVSPPTFAKDFERHYADFIQTRARLERVDCARWEQSLQARHDRGIAKRRQLSGAGSLG